MEEVELSLLSTVVAKNICRMGKERKKVTIPKVRQPRFRPSATYNF